MKFLLIWMLKLMFTYLFKEYCLSGEKLQKIIKLKKTYTQIKIIFEIDDDILSINNLHPEYAKYVSKIEVLKKLYKVADKVITTNDRILKSYKEIDNDKEKYTIPNYIDERIWLSPIDIKIDGKDNSDIVKICYVGSRTHTNDLMFLEQIMNKLKQECKQKFELYLVGGIKEQKSWYKTIEIPNNKTNYPDFVKWLRSISNFDIALAPLNLESELNYSKSYLKYLEYGVMGILGIYTEIKPFKEVIHQKENGILISGNNYDEWIKSLRECIENPQLREKMSRNAKRDIIDNHLLKDNLYRWKEVFTENEGSI